MTRGAIVIVASKGTYTGKPRPAVIVQNDLFTPTHASISVCLITSDCIDAPLFRVALPPGERTGLTVPSQVMVDKIVSLPASAIVRQVGMCDGDELAVIDESLRTWLAL